MPIGAGIAAVSAAAGIGGGLISASAAKDAAKTQAGAATQAGAYQLEAARLAAQMQLGMFNTIRGDLSPYRDFGASSLPGLAALLGMPQPSTSSAGAPPTTLPAGAFVPPGGSPAGLGSAPSAFTGGGLLIPGINAPVPAAAPMRAGEVNWGQVLKDRPDVMAEYQRVLATADRNSPQFQKLGLDRGPEGFAQWWYENQVQGAPAQKAGDVNWGQVLVDRPDVKAEYDRLIATADKNSPQFAKLGLDKGPTGFAQWWVNNRQAEDTYTPPTWTAEQIGQGAHTYKPPTWTQDEIDKLYPQQTAGQAQPGPGAPAGPASPSGAPVFGAGGDIQAYLESLPGYKFARDQGMKAVTNSAAARGQGGMSGAYGKGLARFVTGLADQTYGQQLDRMFRVAGIGQSAANQTGAFGQSAASGAGGALTGGAQAVGQGIIGAANAGAAGQIGAANAIGGGLNSAAGGLVTGSILGMYGGGGAGASVPQFGIPTSMAGLT